MESFQDSETKNRETAYVWILEIILVQPPIYIKVEASWLAVPDERTKFNKVVALNVLVRDIKISYAAPLLTSTHQYRKSSLIGCALC